MYKLLPLIGTTFCSVVLFTACGGGDSSSPYFNDEEVNREDAPIVGTPAVPTAPTPSDPILEDEDPAAPAPSDPAPTEARTVDYFGQDGNLYKPAGDDHGGGGGFMVVLLSAKYSKQFDRCTVPKRDGSTADLTCINNQPWTQIPYSCFSNGNRQTWRANFKCSEVGQIKVTCTKGRQTYVFTTPNEAQRGDICGRYG